MSVVSKNPRIDRYYSPLGTKPNLRAMQAEQDKARAEAIAAVTKQLEHAIADRDEEEIEELSFALTQLTSEPL